MGWWTIYIYGKVTDNQDLVNKGGNNFVEGGMSLSLDVVAAVVPGLTGTGVAYRANNVMKATDKAIDGYKAIDKGRELGKTAERLEGISQSGKKAINVNGNVRYPDKMTLDSIVEVKGGTKIGNRDAGQIRDFVDYAKQTDKQVYVSGRKELNVSKIQDLIDNGSVVKKDLGYMKGYESGKTIRDGIIISNPIRYNNILNNNDSYSNENMCYSDNK